MGHRIWDPFPLSAPTVRRPLPLYAGGAAVSVGGGASGQAAESVGSGAPCGSGSCCGTVCLLRGRVGGKSRAGVTAGRADRAGGSGRGWKAEPRAAGPRGDPAACGSGGALSDIGCHHWFPGHKTFASWAQDIDCLDRRQCFPAYEPLYSFAPSNVLLDPNHTCPVPQTLMYRSPQKCFPWLQPLLSWTPTICCPGTQTCV